MPVSQPNRMQLAAGTRLGAYEIVCPLGAGGMGEVYRARDTKLGRDVAIKFLSTPQFAAYRRHSSSVAVGRVGSVSTSAAPETQSSARPARPATEIRRRSRR